MLDLPTYTHTITCNQESEFYVLDQKNYDRLIEKRNPRVIDMLKKAVRHKYSLRLSWVQDNQIPLLRYFIYKLEEEAKLRSQRTTPNKALSREATLDWGVTGLSKGPLIDMFGPGSVFYTIRMKEKQRHRERERYQSEKRRLQSRSKMTPRATTQTSTTSVAYSNQGTFVTQTGLTADDIEEIHITNGQADDLDGECETHRTRSKLVCEHSRDTMVTCVSNDTDDTDDVDDKEISENALQGLESRIEAWHKSMGEDPYKRHAKRTVKLHRVVQEVCQCKVFVQNSSVCKIDVRKFHKDAAFGTFTFLLFTNALLLF